MHFSDADSGKTGGGKLGSREPSPTAASGAPAAYKPHPCGCAHLHVLPPSPAAPPHLCSSFGWLSESFTLHPGLRSRFRKAAHPFHGPQCRKQGASSTVLVITSSSAHIAPAFGETLEPVASRSCLSTSTFLWRVRQAALAERDCSARGETAAEAECLRYSCGCAAASHQQRTQAVQQHPNAARCNCTHLPSVGWRPTPDPS